MAKQISVQAGKIAGEVVRTTSQITKQTSAGCSIISRFFYSAVEAMNSAMKDVCARFGNLFTRIKEDSRLAVLETKQKDSLQELGKEVFSLFKDQEERVFENDKVKEFLSQVQNYENEIQKVKDEIAVQKQKMEERAIIERVKKELKSDNPRTRKVAIRILERIGNKEEILELLSHNLNDPDPEVRVRVAELVHKLVNESVQQAPSQEPQQVQPAAQPSEPPANEEKKQ